MKMAQFPAFLAIVFAWKVGLVFLFSLPAPSNDSFFYDGAVVNLLEAGRYCNPAIRLALPISGTEVFSAYPPLYQGVLLAWCLLFGTTAFATMLLHLALFGLYLVVLLGISKRLKVESWPGILGGLFLFTITFHDRPDSLAHVFGFLALYWWVRSEGCNRTGSTLFSHFAVGMCVFSLATGLQIGALYALVLFTCWALGLLFRSGRVPWSAPILMVLIPTLSILLVMLGAPRLWQGFLEHANQTPSFTGFRMPVPTDVLKMVRNVPGILAAGILICLHPQRWIVAIEKGNPLAVLTFAATLSSLAIIIASMFVLTANALIFAVYLQPLIVAGCVSFLGTDSPVVLRLRYAAFISLAVLGSIRAVGLATWGVACAMDVGYAKAMEVVRFELRQRASDAPVVLSSAYLYEAFSEKEFQSIHSDWLVPGHHDAANPDLEGLLKLRPATLILTPFDFYRRYQAVLRELDGQPNLVTIRTIKHGRVRPPDSYPMLQRVVQHLSWAPVVVSLDWNSGGGDRSQLLLGAEKY